MYVWIIILLVSLTIVHPVVHNWYPHAWTINEPYLPYKTGLDVMQSHPLRRTRFGQYQACKHFVPGVCIVLDLHAQLTVHTKCIFCLRKMCIHSLVETTFIFSIIHVRVTEPDYLDHGDCFMCVLTLYVTVAMCDWFVVGCTSCLCVVLFIRCTHACE